MTVTPVDNSGPHSLQSLILPTLLRRQQRMSTDQEWEKWGQRDPYFAVLTDSRFRASVMTPEAREEFFRLGHVHVEHVLRACRDSGNGSFSPARILDFGCGVGRLLIPFAQTGASVVGVDISPSMLQEARRNCDAAGVHDVVLMGSDDTLSQVEGEFDLVHTCIVIQHIEPARGLGIFSELVNRIRSGGMGALHVTFAWDHYRSSFGFPSATEPREHVPWWRQKMRDYRTAWRGAQQKQTVQSSPDPEMEMHFYNLSQLMFLLQQAGVGTVQCQLTDHGGAIGALMFFRKGS